MMKNKIPYYHWLFTVIFLSTLVFTLCGIPAISATSLPDSMISFLFYFSALLSQNFLFACLLGLILSPIFFLIKSDRIKLILAAIPLCIGFFYAYMNAKVFSFWRVYINHGIFSMYFSKGGGSQVFEVSQSLYFWISLAIALFLLLALLVLLLSRFIAHYINVNYFIGFFVLLYCITQGFFIFLCQQDNMGLLQYTFKVPYFYNLSIANGLSKLSIPVFPKQSISYKMNTILSNHSKLHYPLHPLNYDVPKNQLNVLLIVVDTLRYDMINPDNMPHVFHFAQHADQFLNNVSGGDCTQPGIFSLFYSIPATYWSSAFANRQQSIVMHAFSDSHYQLGLFASASFLSPPFQRTVFSGIPHLQVMTEGNNAIERDKKITEQMRQFLNKAARNHKPFFGFLFYDAPHAYNALPLYKPFSPVKTLNYFDVNNNTLSAPIFNLYKNAVYFDDGLIEEILETLSKDNLYKNTVVIITSDHGQEFNEYHNNYWEHASGFSKYQIKTPLIIAWPNMKPAIYRYQTTHFDLAPTLLKRVLGVSNATKDYSVGRDYFSDVTREPIIIGNYDYYAFLFGNQIMEFHDSGLYRMVGLQMQPLPHAIPKIDDKNFFTVLARYY